MNIEEKLIALEQVTRELEPGAGQREEVRQKVVEYAESFLNNLADMPVFNTSDEQIAKPEIHGYPRPVEELIRHIYRNIDSKALNAASGGYMGYIPGGGLYYSALGDYLADVSNKFVGLREASPGSVDIENTLLSWMANEIGLPATFGGNLTSGGSVANLIAVVTARDAAGIKGADISQCVVYLTSQAHHSVDKALRIAGMGEAQRRFIAMDEHFRMIPSDLEKQIVQDKNAGLKPWMVITAAGTTNSGAVDPLEACGAITKKHKLWYHVDAAYGGFFILTAEGRKRLKGIEMADSIVMDPHKALFLPYGLGTVLIRDKTLLHKSHYYVANYIASTTDALEDMSPSELSPELTKHNRALRLWVPLHLHGTIAFSSALEEKLLLAKYFYESLSKEEDFEIDGPPDLSIITFRHKAPGRDQDEFNKQLLHAIREDGRIFLSGTTLNGRFTIRMVILSFRTHLEQVQTALQVIREKTRELTENEEALYWSR